MGIERIFICENADRRSCRREHWPSARQPHRRPSDKGRSPAAAPRMRGQSARVRRNGLVGARGTNSQRLLKGYRSWSPVPA
uniref:Uncharacterized protein n=1 Tax=Oryza glumipatula TaxID=40148 RepID=A0A0E0AS98_9ORYZ